MERRAAVPHAFATGFYGRVLEDSERPLAEVIRELRAHASESGGVDTWAAYCFCRDPLATVAPADG